MKLQFPSPQVGEARHRRPVVIVHGTIMEKESIQPVADYALEHGHPVDQRTYPSIRDGEPIEASARLVSRNINSARSQLAEENLQRLRSSAAGDFFAIDGDLYGHHDPNADALLKQADWLGKQVGRVLELAPATLEESFSGRMKEIEDQLSERLQRDTDWNAQTRRKAASEMVDSLAPKAMLIGHSAGGYVAYSLAVNPKLPGQADDGFHYDGANGVGEVVLLSAPVGKGLSEPTPPAMADMPFYYLDTNVLQPLEALPATRLARLNPLVDFSYLLGKQASKLAWNLTTQLATGLSLPLIYAAKPGYEQVTGSSEFFRKFVQDRPLPDQMTVVAVTSDDDRLCLPDRSRVDDSVANGHNLAVDLQLTAEDRKQRPSWGHLKMSERPALFVDQFRQQLVRDPAEAARYLKPVNDDGGRYEVLLDLQEQFQRDPKLLQQARMRPLREALERVAAEELPFRDSPSALARQILG